MTLRYLIALAFITLSASLYGEAYFVHGTGCDNSVWNDVIRTEIREVFGHDHYAEQVELFEWSGDNNTLARIKAADNLLAHILESRASHNIDEPCITLVGHSHGGNVILIASESLRTILGPDIDINIITLNTPNVIGGAQLANPEIIHFNIYCPEDKIIPFAGFNKSGLQDEIIEDNKLKNEYSYPGDIDSGKKGSTSRTFRLATSNIAYNDQYFLKGVIPIKHWSCHRGMLPKNVEQWSAALKVAANEHNKTEIHLSQAQEAINSAN